MTLRRPAERLLISAAACWQLGLAAVTLIPYRLWFEDAGHQSLIDQGAESSAGVVSELSGVLMAYGLVLVVGAIVSAFLVWRLTQISTRVVVVWLAACLVGAFITTDVIGALLYSVALTVYLARTRAAVKVVALQD